MSNNSNTATTGDTNDILDELKKISSFEKHRDPDYNVLNDIHIEENDHTKILASMLRRDKETCLSFLQEFADSEITGEEFEVYDQVTADTTNSKKGYIDLLITNNSYSIIIENKVCNASDHNLQLNKYYYAVKNGSISKESQTIDKNKDNIYIVYLVDNENREISVYD